MLDEWHTAIGSPHGNEKSTRPSLLNALEITEQMVSPSGEEGTVTGAVTALKPPGNERVADTC